MFQTRTNRYGRVIGIGGDDRDYLFDRRIKIGNPIDAIFNKPVSKPKKSNYVVELFKRIYHAFCLILGSVAQG